MKFFRSFVFVAAGMFCTAVYADVKPSTIFQSNMVLPRECPMPVWGTAEPGEVVEVSFDGQKKSVTADKYGKWQITFEPLKMNKNGQEMILKGKKNRVVLNNILVGDVWLCGGQSNMEWPFSSKVLDGGKHMKESANFPLIRRVKVKRLNSDDPLDHVQIQYDWSVCGPKAISTWSTAAYYFARRIHLETGVPIGILENNAGGTPIVLFTATSAFTIDNKPWGAVKPYVHGTPEYKKRAEENIRIRREWLKAAEMAMQDGLPLPALPIRPHKTGYLALYYNTMVAPLARFPVKGVIWYQGCSDAKAGMNYYQSMHRLVKGWRDTWKKELPFYFVQLAAFQKATNDPQGGDGFAMIREAQRKSMDLPNTGMACTIDIGMQNDIHPKNKLDVGERLACWALRDLYGKKDVVVSGPLFKSMEIKNGKAVLSFDYAKGLMTAKKTGLAKPVPVKAKPAHFAIAGADKVWHWADAEIKGEQVIVASDKVKNPVAVRYAFRSYPDGVNMYNAAGLPMVPFRTDNWKK